MADNLPRCPYCGDMLHGPSGYGVHRCRYLQPDCPTVLELSQRAVTALRSRVAELEGEVGRLRKALAGGRICFTGKADGLDRRGFDIISAADGDRIPLGKFVLVEFEQARAALEETDHE